MQDRLLVREGKRWNRNGREGIEKERKGEAKFDR